MFTLKTTSGDVALARDVETAKEIAFYDVLCVILLIDLFVIVCDGRYILCVVVC